MIERRLAVLIAAANVAWIVAFGYCDWWYALALVLCGHVMGSFVMEREWKTTAKK